ncbi:hypothetical protein QBC47DRAFT_40691 [Echria macrotheca]|uniref:Zn(2)-C6 fungal-type domain-containing protein n=1 Tax=Echria macrotheca TaxID=438768 RepID=A0AAJ0BE96_9PEZI|nr:hypothetical protein QBC47DRAFT_40691 [Echria macrotheca]
MPISRKKACSACRESKSRCNLALPCSRCSERGFRCLYANESRPAWPYPATRTLQAVAATPSPDTLTLGGWDSATRGPLFDDGIWDSPPTVTDDLWSGVLGDFSTVQVTPSLDSTTISGARPNSSLSPRKPANPEAYLTSRVIYGQLTSYPKLLIDGRGRLPPFIFPMCILDGESMDECRLRGNGNHTCLPGTLAICVSLLHMFYNRTPASADYVWKTIYDFQRSLQPKIAALDTRELVEALQAMVLFILIQASDIQSAHKNYPASLISTVREIGVRLHELEFYQERVSHGQGSESRRDWTLRESARRTLCVLYMVETVFEVIISYQTTLSDCQGCGRIPLPAERALWEPVDHATWISKYSELTRRAVVRSSSATLTISTLKRLCRRGSTLTEGASERDLDGGSRLEELDYWCEMADEFGTLVWMSAMIDRAP